MIRAYVLPIGLCAGARAMQRISRALARYAPPTVEIVTDSIKADLVVIYAISLDAIEAGTLARSRGQRYAVIQCCVAPTICPPSWWQPLWQQADLTWSYYDLPPLVDFPFNFYHAPLGLDAAFLEPLDLSIPREPLVITTGYVDGPGAEAISEVWQASSLVGLRCIHIGPNRVEGMTTVPDNWTAREGVTDEELALLYRRTCWVASLRHVEGLELPAAEGFSCGARPILFDQPSLRHWYGNAAIYMRECDGEKLTSNLVAMFELMGGPWPVEPRELCDLRATFNWETICTGFWDRLLNGKVAT